MSHKESQVVVQEGRGAHSDERLKQTEKRLIEALKEIDQLH
jgi:hypothetical protein